MKIRHGFVSNSSSSSFIVAFPKPPTSVHEISKMLFNKDSNGDSGSSISIYGGDPVSFYDICSRIEKDISSVLYSHISAKDKYDRFIIPSKGTKNTIANQFENRYHYEVPVRGYHDSDVKLDELGGYWSEDIGEFYGNNIKLMKELRALIIKQHKDEYIYNKTRIKIIKKYLPEEVTHRSYAVKGAIDPNTKKPYTKEQIKAYSDSGKRYSEFTKSNKEYLDNEKGNRKSDEIFYKKSKQLRSQIAKEDAESFLKKYKDHHIFVLEYGDHDRVECIIEHGGIFDNVPHIRTSLH